MLEAHPELFGPKNSMAGAVEDRYLRALTAPEDGLSREIYRRELARMRRELEGERPTPLERLPIDRVVACWLQVQHADKCMAGFEMAKEQAIDHAEFARDRQDRAHRRYLG